GLISIYNATDLSFVKYLLIKTSTIVKAIKKASKNITEFQQEDAKFIVHRFARLNGFPAIVCKSTEESIIFGHIAGMITVWDKKKWKNEELIFTHGKNITGIEIVDNTIISTSMSSSIRKNDLFTKQLIAECKLDKRPLVIYTVSADKILIGLETGEIQIYDEKLNFVKRKERIVPVSDLCIMPKNIAVASRDGEISILDIKNMKLLKKVKHHKKSIQGVFYYNGRLITIGDNSTICFLDTELNELKRVELEEKPAKLHQVKKYIIITSNLVLDLQNDNVIKGEVSKETEDEIEETSLFRIDFSHGDSSIFVNHDRLKREINSDIGAHYPMEIINSIHNLIESQDNMQYKKINPYSVLRQGQSFK
ncbi:MAG: hypothetical protein KGD64_08385, partial [Candidatus Heimdallarchaeota archaeon]|nr:hypothetical protein [Candidatus Heimdallarchaeota archaeon]